jgi:hypothetical protein
MKRNHTRAQEPAAPRRLRNTAEPSGEVSVGDIVAVGETPLVCAGTGWELLTDPVNEVRQGTDGSIPLRPAEGSQP